MTGFARGILYLVYGVIVAGLITAIVLAFHHDNKTPVATKPPTSQGQQQPSKPGSSVSTPKASAPKASTGGGQAANSGVGQTQLGNTGPGDTIGLFAAASLAGAGLYRWRLVRRLD